jgi:hypothetical protein
MSPDGLVNPPAELQFGATPLYSDWMCDSRYSDLGTHEAEGTTYSEFSQ